MLVASVVVVLLFAITFPILLPQRVFAVDYEPADKFFNQTIGEFFPFAGIYFVLFIIIVCLMPLLLAVTKNKLIFAVSLAGNLGVIAYFILQIIEIFRVHEEGIQLSKQVINQGFYVYYNYQFIVLAIAIGIYSVWSIVIISVGLVRTLKRSTNRTSGEE